MKPRAMASGIRGRWLWWLPPTVAIAAWIVWGSMDSPQAATPLAATPAMPAAVPRPAQAAASAAPFSAAGLQTRQEQKVLWQQRLERAQSTLEAYARSTRYPYDSQPAAEHSDQMHPNQPIVDEHALPSSNGKGTDGLRLITSQERIFVQGNESVRLTVSMQDKNGQVVPLRIVRAAAREVPAPRTASLYPEATMNFNDEGVAGDLVAGDGVYGVQLQPATQGFAGMFGQIRVEVALQYRGEQGQTYFDVMYTPDPPATWEGGVMDALEDGSLNFHLKAGVKEPGRYVVTGRVDDANGKSFALLSFNEELGAGSQDIRLKLFGKLIRDFKPALPLTLRDVEGFLLRPDAFPDRRLMPRLAGSVHVSKSYALASFSDAPWTSEERSRYLAELTRDVTEAQAKVEQFGP
jgi:hypothetical protein